MDRIDESTLRQEVEAARSRGTDRDAKALVRWGYDLLGDKLMMSTAFGKSGMVILHMVRDLAIDLPVYFLDTAYHFPETIQYIEMLRASWGVNFILKRPKLYGPAFEAAHGAEPYRTDPDFCCHKNKVEPFAEILEGYQGWITGVRRDQGESRAQAEPIEVLEGAKLKLQPLVFWSRAEVEAYIKEHDIPLHPLFAQGYTSIGCAPCTRLPIDPSDERSGRWAGLAKRECGLQTSWKAQDGAGPVKSDAAEGDGTRSPQGDKVEFLGKMTASRLSRRTTSIQGGGL
jgi:phosphoadenosine phosphosulfate reductase